MRPGAYLTYVPSESVWFDQVPVHWQQLRLKHVIERMESGVSVNSDAAPAGANEFGVLKTSCVYGDQFDPSENKRVLDEESERVACGVKGNRLIISRMNTPELVGSCGYVPRDFPNLYLPDRLWQTVFSGSRQCEPKFVWYFLTSSPIKSAISSLAAGTSGSMQNIGQDAFMAMGLLLPPLEEQQSIVRYLDAQTFRIDKLVSKKRALVDRLKEMRSALIARIVTSGLPPQVADAFGLGPRPPMKASGVEWFGDVPGHWTVKQLKWAVMFQRGHDLPSEQREEGTVPLVTSAGVSATHSVAAAKGPGIVTGRYGTIGQFHLVFEDYWPLNTTLYSVDLYGNDPNFLRFLLEHLSPLVILHSVKSAVPGVDRNDLHPTMIALPPREEQRAIAAYLDGEISRLDQLAACVRKVMTRLTEYRQALITSAVTGKIDVRERSVEPEAA